MVTICKQCWASCDVDEPTEMDDYYDDELEDTISNLEYQTSDYGRSLCCLAPVIEIDEEVLETISMKVENECFTFDDALEKYGDIAFYIAENLVFIPGYDEV